MTKFTITVCAVLSTALVFANNDKLEKARERYSHAKSISYRATAFYPNPDTDEVTSFSTHYTIYNFRDGGYDFRSKSESLEERYENDFYTQIHPAEKTYYQYENKKNQVEDLKSSRLALYGPVSLLKHPWVFANDTMLAENALSHYAWVESERKFEDRTIKIEYHIYIASDYSIVQFERKSFVDNKLGQTVTYKFDEYTFSNEKRNSNDSLPENYSLKYFERIETLKPLKENTKAPVFEATDITGNKISIDSFSHKTLLLFSSTNCGYSKIVSDYINNANFVLSKDVRLINIYGTDSKENAIRVSKKYTKNYPVIADRKDLEKTYGIAGYPVLYLVNEKGVITDAVSGSDKILPFLKKLNESNE